MNDIARQLNDTIGENQPIVLESLSRIGRNLFFPKGILSQSAEAREKAHRMNATIGIATEKGGIMHFPSIMAGIDGIGPEESLTYASSFGIPALRKAWKDLLFKKNPSLAGKEISLPVVTCGITNGLSVAADLFTDPGGIVILPKMMWGNYNMILKVRKEASIRNYDLLNEEGGFNLPEFEKCLRASAAESKKIIVILNFPHNPTGYSPAKEEGEKIAGILLDIAEKGTNIVTVFDDAYFGLFFEEETMKESLFAKVCGCHERLLAVKLDGATKENYAWGLRVGFITYGASMAGTKGDWAALYDAMERKTAGCVRGNISNASHLSQTLVLRSIENERFDLERDEKFDILKKRAAMVKTVLKDPKYKDAWTPYPFNSGYFMCLRLKDLDAETLRCHLLDKYGVGVISLGKRDIRVAFSCLEEEDTVELFDTMLKGVEDLG